MSRTVSPKSTTATVVKKIDQDTPFIRDLVRRVEESHQDDAVQEMAELDINLILTRLSQEEAQILRKAKITHDGTLHEENPVTFLQFTNLNKKHRLSEFLKKNLLINPNEIINHRGETILHQLSQQEPSEEIIKKISRLLELGANPNIKNCHGNTPFFFACDIVEDESTEVISQMLKYDANPFIQNNFKITPLDNCRSSHSATKQLIESYADEKLTDLRELNIDLLSRLKAAWERSSGLETKISELTGQTLLLEEGIAEQKSKLDVAEREKTETASENLRLKLEKAKLEEDHQKAMADQKAELTAQYQKDIEKLRAELTAKHKEVMADQKAELAARIKELKAEYQETIDSISAELKAGHQRAMADQKAELKALHQKAMAYQKAELAAQRREALDSTGKEYKAQNQKTIDSVRAELTTQHQKAMADQKAELTAQHQKDIEKLRAELTAKHEEAMADKDAHLDPLRVKLDELLPLPHTIKKQEEELQSLSTDNTTLRRYNIELGQASNALGQANQALNLQLQQLTQKLFLTQEKLNRACLKIGEQSIEPRHVMTHPQSIPLSGIRYPMMPSQTPPHQMLTHENGVVYRSSTHAKGPSLPTSTRGPKPPLHHTPPPDGKQPPSPGTKANSTKRVVNSGEKTNTKSGRK